MFDFMPFAGIGVTIVVVAFSLFFVFRVVGGLARGTAERDRLLRVGYPARARILGVQMGGMTVTVGVDRQLQIIINAEIHAEGRAPFPAQITALVSELQIPQVQPGAWAAVRVDPMNPANIALEATGVGPPGTPGPGFGGGFAQAPGGFGAAAPGGFGAATPGGFGAPAQAGYGGGFSGAGYGPSPAQGPYGQAAYGGQPGFAPAAAHMPVGTPVRGFRMPLGAKIGLGIGLVGALIGIVVAIVAVSWTSGIGGPSEVCEKAAKCCRKMAGANGASASCDNLTKQSGPIADKVCEETLKSFRESKSCK